MHKLDLFQEMNINDLSNDILKTLALDPKKIRNVIFQQLPSSTVLQITIAVDWNELSPKELKYFYYSNLLDDEVYRIKDNIRKEIFSIKSTEKTEHYIHKLQQCLVTLCFKLIKLLNVKEQNAIYAPSVSFTDTDILNLTYIALEKLLRFFEKNYLNFINQNINIPYRSALLQQYDIDQKLHFVKARLLNSNLNPALLKIIYIPFLKLSAITLEERMSYKELIYLNTYLHAFYEDIKANKEPLNESHVCEILYRVNYNCFELQFYETARITAELELIEEIPEKIDYLYHRLKVVNQRRCRVNIYFDPALPSLKDQLTGWLEEEINYMNKKLQLRIKSQPTNLFTAEEKPKIETGLTVAQLAFFYKLQVDVGIIKHKAQQDIFKHISENYQTANASEISQTSIKNKFYNIETSTIEILKQKTIEILNQLKAH